MQPVVGVLADSSKSKWGRRRPFMIGGSLIVGLCLVVLGWTSEIVGIFVSEPVFVSHLHVFQGGKIAYTTQKRSCTIALAVISIYAVDFAINAGKCSMMAVFRLQCSYVAVQSSCRSLIVDTLPIPKQQLGSAWGKLAFLPASCVRALSS